MAQSAVSMVFQGNGEIKFYEIQGEFCLTAEDIGRGLGYEYPADSINKLYRQYRDELKDFSTELVVKSTGRPTKVFTEEGIYIISMLARTEKAKEFRQKVASLLKDLRQRKMEAIRKETVIALIDFQHSLPKKRNMDWVERLIKYRRLGLRQWEVGKLLDCSKDTICRTEKMLKKFGLWDILTQPIRTNMPMISGEAL
jgi:prophage antirepressor-like protein